MNPWDFLRRIQLDNPLFISSVYPRDKSHKIRQLQSRFDDCVTSEYNCGLKVHLNKVKIFELRL